MDKRINFRAQFEVRPVKAGEKDWYRLSQVIADWVNSVIGDDLLRKTVFNGILKGSLREYHEGFSINVRSIKSHNYQQAPQIWALEFKHDEKDEKSPYRGWREWVNDIAIERDEESGSFKFSLTNSYQIKSGFIRAVEEPTISSPNLVKRLLDDDFWVCTSGGQLLKLAPVAVNNQNVKDFIEFLFRSNRQLPIIYISKTREEEYLIDVERLAKKVAGNAHVYFEESLAVSDYLRELKKLNEYRCYNGMVRVFLPKINPSYKSDFINHRFFRIDYIREKGAKLIENEIAESLVRRSQFIKPFPLISIRDVDLRIVALKLEATTARLEEALSRGQNEEIVKAYAEQVQNQKEKIEKLESENREYVMLYELVDKDKSQMQADLDEEKSKNYILESRITDLTSALQEKEQKEVLLLEEFPTNLAEFLVFLQKNCANIVVLDEAFKSAQTHTLRDLSKAWKLLRAIAVELHVLKYIEKVGNDLDAEFKNRTTFEFAWTESFQTKDDRTLMDKRKRIYKGKEIHFMSHVKFGVKPDNLLRVYIHFDNDEKKIVIGHCGEHLPTGSSKKLKLN
jgi:hypothetical protein